MRRGLLIAAAVAGVAYVAVLVALLVGQARAPVDSQQLAATRRQLHSTALEGALTAQRLGSGTATPPYAEAAAAMLSQQTDSLAQSLATSQYTPDAQATGKATEESARELEAALEALQAPDAKGRAAELQSRFETIAKELSS